MKKLLGMILILATMQLTACGFEIIDSGHVGVEIENGKIVGEVLQPGFQTHSFFTGDIIELSTRPNTYTRSAVLTSKDNQKISLEYTVTWAINPSQAQVVYEQYANLAQLEERVLQPKIAGSIRDAIGNIGADELSSKLEAAKDAALKDLRASLETNLIVASDLQLTNLDFDDSYEQAVKEKVVANQMAQKAVNDTRRIEEEAKQVVKTAQADAEAMRIKSQALAQNKGLVQFEMVQKWDGKLPQYMFGNSVPMIDFKSLQKE